jgi:hypothetical protein
MQLIIAKGFRGMKCAYPIQIILFILKMTVSADRPDSSDPWKEQGEPKNKPII